MRARVYLASALFMSPILYFGRGLDRTQKAAACRAFADKNISFLTIFSSYAKLETIKVLIAAKADVNLVSIFPTKMHA